MSQGSGEWLQRRPLGRRRLRAVATLGAITASSAATDSVGGIAISPPSASSRIATPTDGTHTVSTSFLGRSVDNTSVLGRYTLYGDTNLDGKIDSYDYAQIDAAYAATHSSWMTAWSSCRRLDRRFPVRTGTTATSNYDGVVDGADYALIDTANAFSAGPDLDGGSHPGACGGLARATPSSRGPGLDAPSAARRVPEPGSCHAFRRALLLGLRRRRSAANRSAN